jgi:hypothetical protein
MNRVIEAVEAVSDGVVVEFQGGTRCYFSAEFLLQNIDHGSNRIFLDYDPTPAYVPDLLTNGQILHAVSSGRLIREN